MNKKRVMTCLAAGVCILAVSATAAFGSVNGYANYKTAVKDLALTTDNVSAQATFSVSYDDKSVLNGKGEFAKDGSNNSSHYVVVSGSDKEETYTTTLNGVNTWFEADSDHFYTTEYPESEQTHGLLDVTEDDELSRRIVNFLELGADTVMGDLKNNVVEIDASNGEYTYQLDISNSQVPAVVNAGLSVLAYAASENVGNTQYVDFEDWSQSALRYYEEQTGETLSQEFKDFYTGEVTAEEDWYENNQETLDKLAEKESEMHEHYYEQLTDELNKRGVTSGILFVAVDGSTTFYPDEAAYQKAHNDGVASVGDVEDFIGKDLTLDNVHFTFTVNKAGQLTANHIEAFFTTVDRRDAVHNMVLTGDLTFFDYGTTVIQPLDTGDRTNWNADQEDF